MNADYYSTTKYCYCSSAAVAAADDTTTATKTDYKNRQLYYWNKFTAGEGDYRCSVEIPLLRGGGRGGGGGCLYS